MTRRDTWSTDKVRPTVQRWRAFATAVQAAGVTVQDGDEILFVVPMPKSWNKMSRRGNDGQPHRQKPDLDNLLGGLFDAAMPKEDKHIARLGEVSKTWGDVGLIVITRKDTP